MNETLEQKRLAITCCSSSNRPRKPESEAIRYAFFFQSAAQRLSPTNMDRSCAATILSKVGQALPTGGWAYRRKVRPFFTPASVFKGGGVAVLEQECAAESV
jgi:hypothetical protein